MGQKVWKRILLGGILCVFALPANAQLLTSRKKAQNFVTGLRVIPSPLATAVVIESTVPIDIPIQIQEGTDSILLALPKTDWKNVKVDEKSGSLIKRYFLVQENPNYTFLILTVQPQTKVIKKAITAQTLTEPATYVLYLSDQGLGYCTPDAPGCTTEKIKSGNVERPVFMTSKGPRHLGEL